MEPRHRLVMIIVQDLTGAFPQGRALAHEENRLAACSSQLRLPAQWSPPEARLLPLQMLLLSLLGQADVPPTLVEAVIVVLAVGGGEARVARARVLAFGPFFSDAFGKEAEELATGEVVSRRDCTDRRHRRCRCHRCRRHRARRRRGLPDGPARQEAVGPELLGEELVLVEVADLRHRTSRRRGGRRREGAQGRRDDRVENVVLATLIEVARQQQLLVVELIVRHVRRPVVDPFQDRTLVIGQVPDFPPDATLTSRATSLRWDKPYRTAGASSSGLLTLFTLRGPLAASATRTRAPGRARTLEVALRTHAG